MTKQFFASIMVLTLVAMVVGVAVNADETVTATVTPKLVSISVSETTVGYGFVNVPSTDNVPQTPSTDVIISVQNTGNVNEDFDVKGSDAIGTTVDWTIVDAAPGATTYNHRFLDCDADSACTAPAAANNMTTTQETLGAGVTGGSFEYFQLRLSTPTETGGDTTEHSTTVTVIATAS